MNLDNHPKRKLINDVSMDELLQMRKDGMSNMDIAHRTGVSKATIYRYLGPQPKGIRYDRMAVDKRPRPAAQDEATPARTASRLSPCSQVWAGRACRMEVNYTDGYISISPDTGDTWCLDALPDVISDLISLMRCVEKENGNG